MPRYDHKEIEPRWQAEWEQAGLFKTREGAGKKAYILDMFPYPSGNGLHVGHPLGYLGSDIISRKRRMEGWSVLHPMGWDAFGLPAENFAVKTGIHPKDSTKKNSDNFRRQLKMLGLSFDWDREINTSSPEYYRWTQWLFLYMYKRGLAYKGTANVNWCGACQTVLANEQVVDGKCERSGDVVVQREMSQWFFRITQYADRLLEDLEGLDWPERIKAMQRNWIGKSQGAEIVFRGFSARAKGEVGRESVSEVEFEVPVFTTRPDTLMGVSYVVLAPEHPLVPKIVAPDRRDEALRYVDEARRKTELERTGTDLGKTGVSLGVHAAHPITGAPVELWIADYALANYGTGAVMGVPAHDDRDFAFAKKHGLPVRHVIAPPPDVAAQAPSHPDHCYTGEGTLINSGEFDGLGSHDAKDAVTQALADKQLGGKRTQYHLRDWLFSRQRYWGAPIPIVYCDECGEVPVPEERLPVELPYGVDFKPTGESPLKGHDDFVNAECPKCGGAAKRETDTMDGFVCSSWYFLRYASPQESQKAFDPKAVAYWAPVDLYVGGAEHAVMHLLYARFFTKALFDGGLVGFTEPFTALRNQGMILGENGEKMSKSRGNVINPDDVVAEWGADTLRTYEMFMGDFEDKKPWDTKGITGVRRFLDRSWALAHEVRHKGEEEPTQVMRVALHKCVKKVTADVEAFKFNTAVSAMMILVNEWSAGNRGDREYAGTLARLLSPFAPHLADEMWRVLGFDGFASQAPWPWYDEDMTKDAEVTVAVQVNGKLRDTLKVPAGLGDEDLKAKAYASPKISALIEGRTVVKVIIVADKLVSIVLQ